MNSLEDRKRLADYIRTGAKLRPQCKGDYWKEVDGVMGTCALGAALEAMGTDVLKATSVPDLGFFMEEFNLSEDLVNGVVNKNDTEEMSREEIADWLEKDGAGSIIIEGGLNNEV